jgi:redox-sensing transcriptional repressor
MNNIPFPTKRRLVLLERLLAHCTDETITSQEISHLTGWSTSVIRRDIALLKINCGAPNGYKTKILRDFLGKLFCEKKESLGCCIVGLGRMGQVLLETPELFDSPFKIVAGFDSSVNKTEVLSSSFPLHPTTLMKKIIREEKIEYAILTVSSEEAQGMTNDLVDCGIRGIVNYTPRVLKVPPKVSVENVSLLTALEILAI